MTVRPAPPVPRALLFGDPVFSAPEVSPDGRRLVYVAPLDGVPNVWVAPVEDPAAAVPVTHDSGRGIRSYRCCHDDRTLTYLRDEDGDENWRLHLLDLVTGAERCATPFDDVQTRVLAHNRWHPDTVLLGLNRERPHLHDLYRLELSSGRLTEAARNPGYLTWVVDTDLAPRGGTAMRPDGGMTVHLAPPGSDDARPWLEVPYEDAMTTRILGFDRTGRTCYLLSSIDANTTRLFAVDVATDRRTLLAGDPTYDVRRVELDPETRVPQAVVFGKDRGEWTFLDGSLAKELDRVRASPALQGADTEVVVDRSDRTGRRWTVTVVRSDGPVRFYLYDRADGGLRHLFDHQPELARYRLAPMEPFACTARDGETVHGYVTWPAGTGRDRLPAVVNVHGGPWARNSWGFDEEAQWLASLGYACVQVNFRGSTGYGKRFRNLGAGQWGAAMQTDLLDAVDHLAADGTIDPARVAIMGCSYGGYAALAGAAFTPDRFACAVDLCGPSNLLTLLAGGAPYRTPLRSFMDLHVGDPDTDQDMLRARSPLSRAGDIVIPVLVAQGANDVRVPRAEAEQIVAALEANGVPHEYLLFPDEGHGLTRARNRETYYAAVEAFLARHLG